MVSAHKGISNPLPIFIFFFMLFVLLLYDFLGLIDSTLHYCKLSFSQNTDICCMITGESVFLQRYSESKKINR